MLIHTRRLVNPGDLVQAATSTRTAPLFSLQKLDTVRVFADVPEASAAGIRPGLPADVKLYGPAGVTVPRHRHPHRDRARSCDAHDAGRN